MPGVNIRHLDSEAPNFESSLTELLNVEGEADAMLGERVADILARVRKDGDLALLDLTRQFDRWQPQNATDLRIDAAQLEDALQAISAEQVKALQHAAQRIRDYHEQQVQSSWQFSEPDGTALGQKITPLQRVGIYVPGGKAVYPSSVLMNALPAGVAGVEQIVMMVPTPDGEVSPILLAAAHIAGIECIYRVGGAQAIAALAYGTATLPKVDKIVGPGNVYVAEAKRQVYGTVGLDMLAGPSEILIICDGQTDPRWIALDLFSQAEHDEMAQSILLCPDAEYLASVHAAINELLPEMERRAVIEQSLARRGALIKVPNLGTAVALANRIAPEHLELSVADPTALLDEVRHAGAIFMGRHTPEALGDYCVGSNHVLPTAGSARFASPLGVYDFQKRTSIIHCSPAGSRALAQTASVLARSEGLTAHARSAECRAEDET
ncbi:MAG: histidinol dehydrogenase [Pseudomonadales bacterium]